HEERGVLRQFRPQRAGAIGASSIVTPPTACGQRNLESCIECVPHHGRGGLAGPPPPRAAGGAPLSGVQQGPDMAALTTTPAELLSFYTGINTRSFANSLTVSGHLKT